ncbi:MAG: DUF5103 domain-containing protein [Cytophagales bacterium]|nr:DUF5103 domain-containing protein [Cytophagales bacterium]
MRILLSFLLLLLTQHIFSQDIVPIDSVYNDDFRSVQFYQTSPSLNPQDVVQAPVLELGKENLLILEFDEISEENKSYTFKIFAYNKKWTNLSFLLESDYLEEYNEFNILDIQPSFNTQIGYTHYYTEIPKVKNTGNFLLAVYDEDEKIVLTRRFMVFQDISMIGIPHSPQSNTRLQQFSFTANLPNNILNPTERIYTTVRRNAQWQSVKIFERPTYFQNQRLTYKLFTLENSFEAGNEFRVFDSRSIRFKGFHINHIADSSDYTAIFLVEDSTRHHQYLTFNDVNGQYLVDHYELGDGDINSDYLQTFFFLRQNKLTKDIYVYGALSDWKLKKEFKMEYDAQRKMYFCAPLLKQGYYNYQYVIKRKNKIDYTQIEGSHFQTENGYEIFIYYTNLSNIDELIGYKKFSINP